MLDAVRYIGVHMRKNAIEAIAEALNSSGHRSLDQQARALGLPRSTVWTIIKNKHKVGRLSKKTANRILTNAETPPAIRAVVQRYLADK
jgi:plasmid maintenance system antidote protein VapI